MSNNKTMKLKAMTILAIIVQLFTILGCDNESSPTPRTPSLPASYTMSSDKAAYNPGEQVKITVLPAISGTVAVRYKHLGNVIGENNVTGSSFTWTPPGDDFKGYMVELYEPKTDSKAENILATIGVDVSSAWTRFPRYGFLSKFPSMTETQIREVMSNLNRHHINGLQFYDWHYKHHQPLAGTPENPTLVYRDIINREIHFNTVKKYIDIGHEHNIRSMFYNLVYGALKDAPSLGVEDSWYVYTNSARTEKDRHPLSSPFISDIFLTDPSNTEWQSYLINENRKVYQALAFDGFHMDQLGDRGTRYNYSGTQLNLALTFQPFIEAVDADAPEKYIVMNAVNQYGQERIANAPVDFLYTEVWSPNDTYNDLANIILQNNNLSKSTMNTVLAAYVNYDLANNPGFFNTPSVLMMDAVIFAFGGAHLELGEHMLAKEYFPNSNLAMRDDLKRILTNYYDFLVAYENVLRDGGTFNTPALVSADNKFQFSNWPAQSGKVSVVGKEIGNTQVLHLLNFTNAKTMQWRDNGGIQASPNAVEKFQVRFTPAKPVKRIWFASPDFWKGASAEVAFATNGNQVSFTVPGLQYWSMLVVEYQ
jgi:dextranase